MTNQEKYDQIFMDCFSVGKEVLNEKFVYQCVPLWDSVGQMSLVTALEEAFNIMMATDDIIDFSSYTIGIKILAKYDVTI